MTTHGFRFPDPEGCRFCDKKIGTAICKECLCTYEIHLKRLNKPGISSCLTWKRYGDRYYINPANKRGIWMEGLDGKLVRVKGDKFPKPILRSKPTATSKPESRFRIFRCFFKAR